MKTNVSYLLTVLLLGNVTGAANASDTKRQGFQAGLGVGAHSSSMTYQSNFAPSSVGAEQNLAVDLQLGYGFTNRIVGFIGGKGGSVLIDNREGVVGISGLGATFYWSESAPSLYLTGMAGTAYLSMGDEDAELRDTGRGWSVGGGFEMAKGLHLELSYSQATVADPVNAANTTDLDSTYATVKYIWY